ncbi:ABC transporter permease [Micrococcales bacterium 31B]|nr:ABC transporter permease [Micrococcales bacterium 31B]
MLVSEATLDMVAPDAPVIEAWYSLDDTWDFRAAQELRSEAQEAATSASQELQTAAGVDYGNSTWPAVQAPGVDRLVYEGLAALLLLVVLALLVTSVVIALVGVSTTMSLSVIERQREIGLLRSIGMSTRQVRQSVVAEAVIVSLAATVLGVVLGIGFGAVGTVSALPASGTIPVRIEIPWWQVGAAVLVMVLAGVVAAWTPARRGSRVSPVRALAESPT